MKELIAAIAKALANLECLERAGDIEQVAKALAQSKFKKVEAIREVLSRFSQLRGESNGPALGSLLPALSAFYDVLLVAGAKKKNLGDLKALLDLFGEHRHLSLDEFCEALRPTKIGERPVDHQLVDVYLAKLEEALGDEHKFSVLYDALTADRRIAQPEAVELASRFLAPIAKGTSRPKALRRLLYRHEKLLESRRASESIAARR